MLELALGIVAFYGILATGLIYLLLSGRLVTRRELDKETGLTSEWKEVALRSIANSEYNTALAQKTTKAMEELIAKQTLPPTLLRSS